jgi:hypothetical protein
MTFEDWKEKKRKENTSGYSMWVKIPDEYLRSCNESWDRPY